jgi:quinate dehydrogenase
MDTNPNESKTLHLVGIGVKHSIAPSMHNFIAESLCLPWKFYSTECSTVEDVVAIARNPTTAGLVVTMPYKNTIMPFLDRLDDLATTIGACNNIYRSEGQLVGTNTDWLGIKGCLLEKGDEERRPRAGSERPALIVGAGGASRAAVYALSTQLHSSTIYILNRDEKEVEDLNRDIQKLSPPPTIVHIKTMSQARELETPYYIVGTVPDMEPKTESERAIVAILTHFLEQKPVGVLLDMCFKPRRTRMIILAEKLGWPCIDGTHVIGYQIQKQWMLWAGKERAAKLDSEGAWKTLLKAAEESTAIN